MLVRIHQRFSNNGSWTSRDLRVHGGKVRELVLLHYIVNINLDVIFVVLLNTSHHRTPSKLLVHAQNKITQKYRNRLQELCVLLLYLITHTSEKKLYLRVHVKIDCQ